MKRILIVFGTRPEAIKLCPLANELKNYADHFETTVCVSAQHRQMLDQVLKIFDIHPAFDLNVMKHDQTLFDITSRILIETGKVIEKVKPDIVIVQGDTTTTFATALAAYYHQVKVGHVEAGLRTFNKYSPFPEEINRKLTSAVTDIHFAPTEIPKQNLLNEGIKEENILVTGNTVIDALLWVRSRLDKDSASYPSLKDINFNKKIILVTGHRRENFGQEFINFCNALKSIATSYPDVEVVYPVHLNPNVRKPVFSILADVQNIKLIEPLDYEPFIYMMDHSYFIISDSGGIQEEAPSLGKPVLVTRNTTERPEAVSAGAVKLVGTNSDKIIQEAKILLEDKNAYQTMASVNNPYGDGTSSKKIINWLLNNL